MKRSGIRALLVTAGVAAAVATVVALRQDTSESVLFSYSYRQVACSAE